MDIEKVKARGPWVLVMPEPVRKRTGGGLYLPDGNLVERLGHIVGYVVSAGKGHFEKVDGSAGEKERFVPCEVLQGDRVIFRGHLKEANTVGDRGHCFLHQKDLIGVLEEGAELDLALPYDN